MTNMEKEEKQDYTFMVDQAGLDYLIKQCVSRAPADYYSILIEGWLLTKKEGVKNGKEIK